MKQERQPRQVMLLVGIGLFGMLLLWLGGVMALSALVGWARPTLLTDMPWAMWLVNDLPLYGLAMPLFLLVLRQIPEKATPEPARPRFTLSPMRFLLLLVLCFGCLYLFGIIGNNFITFINWLTGQPQTDNLTELAMANNIFTNFIFGACVPALGEEFLFRKMLYRKMRGSGDAIYMFVSSFAFATFHANFGQALYAFALGLIFAWLYAKTGKLWLTMLLHFIINLVGIVLTPLLPNEPLALTILGMIMLVLIAAALALFFILRKRVWAGLTPPTEDGWPNTRPHKWQRKMAAQLPAPHYTFAMMEMQYPPFSDNPAENQQIVAGILQQPFWAAPPQWQAPVQPNYPWQPQPPFNYPWQPQPPSNYPWQPQSPAKPKGILRFCLGNVGMVLYSLLSLAVALLTLFSGLLTQLLR